MELLQSGQQLVQGPVDHLMILLLPSGSMSIMSMFCEWCRMCLAIAPLLTLLSHRSFWKHQYQDILCSCCTIFEADEVKLSFQNFYGGEREREKCLKLKKCKLKFNIKLIKRFIENVINY